MERVSIKKSDSGDNGTWQHIGQRLPVIYCPNCGLLNMGCSTHRIEDNGDVNNSVVCPHDCDFHDWVNLSEWDGGTIEREKNNGRYK